MTLQDTSTSTVFAKPNETNQTELLSLHENEVVPPTKAEMAQWISDLSSNSFSKRDRAAALLLRSGEAAIPLLKEAAKSPELELHLQAERLVAQIADGVMEKMLSEFEADVDGSKGISLPGWERVSNRIGSNAETRKLFVKLFRAERELLAVYGSNSKQASKSFNNRLKELYGAYLAANRNRNQFGYRVNAVTESRYSILALMVLGSDKEIEVNEGLITQLDTLWQRAWPYHVKGGLAKSEAMRFCLGEWISHRSDSPNVAQSHIILGMSYDAKQTLVVALKYLKESKNQQQHTTMYALLCVAKFGDKTNIPALLPFLENENIVMSGTRRINKKNVAYKIQVRDLALVSLIHLSDQKYVDYGFKHINTNGPYFIQYYSIYFENEGKDRDIALEKWKKWAKEHPEIVGKEFAASAAKELEASADKNEGESSKEKSAKEAKTEISKEKEEIDTKKKPAPKVVAPKKVDDKNDTDKKDDAKKSIKPVKAVPEDKKEQAP